MTDVSRMDIANNCIDLYFEWDIQRSRFRWSAPKFCFLGYDIRQLTPSEDWWASRVHPEDLDRLMSVLADLIGEESTDCSVVFRFKACRGGYSSVWAKCFVANLDEGSILCGSICVIPQEHDMVRKKPSMDIEQFEMFASMASHELKEPVRTMEAFYRLFVRSLDMEAISGEQRELIGYVDAAVTKLKVLLKGLIQYGSTSLYTPKLEVLDFEELVKDVLASLHRRILERKVDIRYEGELGEVLLDRFLVCVILQNLVLNAIKYNPSTTPTIVIQSRHCGTDVVFSVTDNGMGIEEEYVKLIFEPFHRVSPNQGAKGTGLGLSVALKAAEKLNGRICCHSVPCVGSTFEVRLFEQFFWR